ncbi:recombinase family protein [Crossiella sp. SN42]|uniref:recombinase family protein n=1 Tax=Crossiella sp. SN42 TaxID=2944808 RepID=UPI00207CF70D|nr:recombinase family protein [Crossiella sp. SN42]MCO1579158.1 recombinase family protein [Crossiella sp. SN42]
MARRNPTNPVGVLYLAANNPANIPRQRTACHRLADTLDMPVVAEFIRPETISGVAPDNPAIAELLAYLAAHTSVSHVFAYSLSCLGRNRLAEALTRHQLNTLGVVLATVT